MRTADSLFIFKTLIKKYFNLLKKRTEGIADYFTINNNNNNNNKLYFKRVTQLVFTNLT